MSKKVIRIFALLLVFVLSGQVVNGEIDYASKTEYYQNLCSKKSGYRANKKACRGFEKYLSDQKSKIDKNEKSIKENIKNTKGDINKIENLIKQNTKLIKSKQTQITETKENIQLSKKQIKELEEDLLDRLALMQEINTDNFVIDFLTSSVNLNDFLTKVDGIDLINKANDEVISDLNDQKKKLTKDQKELKKAEVTLKESQKTQNTLLKEYRTKESDLFERLAKERVSKANYNDALDNLDLDNLDAQLNNDDSSSSSNNNGSSNSNKPSGSNGSGSSSSGSKPSGSGSSGSSGGSSSGGSSSSSSKLGLPVSHATVTATAWYYPASFGGGWHPGIDLANKTNTLIKSPGKGVVLMKASEYGGYGNYMVTVHQVGNDTYTFLYGHMNKFGSPGSTLSKGETIGYMGSTGNSTGPHAHVEIFKHKNKTLSQVVKKYKKNYDIYFGLGYTGTGNCNSVCRLKPQSYYGLKYGQSY